MIYVVLGAVIVAIALAVVVARGRRTPDGVSTFQRQINALSPEARRSVVQRLEDVTKRDDGPLAPGATSGDDGGVDGA